MSVFFKQKFIQLAREKLTIVAFGVVGWVTFLLGEVAPMGRGKFWGAFIGEYNVMYWKHVVLPC